MLSLSNSYFECFFSIGNSDLSNIRIEFSSRHLATGTPASLIVIHLHLDVIPELAIVIYGFYINILIFSEMTKHNDNCVHHFASVVDFVDFEVCGCE